METISLKQIKIEKEILTLIILEILLNWFSVISINFYPVFESNYLILGNLN